MFCKRCGEKIQEGARFCKYCGKELKLATKMEEETTEQKSLSRSEKKDTGEDKKSSIRKSIAVGAILFVIISVVIYIFVLIINREVPTITTESSVPKTEQIIKYTTTNLNLRGDGDEGVIRVLPKWTKVVVIEEGAEWTRVVIDNQYGWVASEYLTTEKRDDEEVKEKIESIIEATPESSSFGPAISTYFSNSIARIICYEDYYSDYYFYGSGSIWWGNNKYWIITNNHVLDGMERCIALITTDWGAAAEDALKAFREDNIIVYNINLDDAFYIPTTGYDLAYSVLEEIPDTNQPLNLLSLVAMVPDVEHCNESYPIGTKIQVFGYPGIGSDAVITLTEGIISSFEKVGDAYYYLTSAKIEEGNSGGLALTDTSQESSCAVGIPTFVQTGEIESLGRILVVTEADINYWLSTSNP